MKLRELIDPLNKKSVEFWTLLVINFGDTMDLLMNYLNVLTKQEKLVLN